MNNIFVGDESDSDSDYMDLSHHQDIELNKLESHHSEETTSEIFQRKVDAILAPFKKEPKQSKLTEHFVRSDGEPIPSTSAAYFASLHEAPEIADELIIASSSEYFSANEGSDGPSHNETNYSEYWNEEDDALLMDVDLNISMAEQYLKDDDDEIAIRGLLEYDAQQKKYDERNKQMYVRAQEEIFWEKIDEEQRIFCKEMEHRHRMAKIRRKNRYDNFAMRDEIRNMFWCVYEWPAFVVEIMLSCEFKYNDRLTLATFFHGNGLINPDFPIEIFKFYNKYWKTDPEGIWERRFYAFSKVFHYLNKIHDKNDPDGERMSSQYYYYSMVAKHMIYYNGRKRSEARKSSFYDHTY